MYRRDSFARCEWRSASWNRARLCPFATRTASPSGSEVDHGRTSPERRREVSRRRRLRPWRFSTTAWPEVSPRTPRRPPIDHESRIASCHDTAASGCGLAGGSACADRALDNAVGRAGVFRRNSRSADRRCRGRVRGGKRVRPTRARRPGPAHTRFAERRLRAFFRSRHGPANRRCGRTAARQLRPRSRRLRFADLVLRGRTQTGRGHARRHAAVAALREGGLRARKGARHRERRRGRNPAGSHRREAPVRAHVPVAPLRVDSDTRHAGDHHPGGHRAPLSSATGRRVPR